MYAVHFLIIFILVFSGNYVQKTSAARGPPPCKRESNGRYRCQGVFECNHNVNPAVCCPWERPMLDGGQCRLSNVGEPCTVPYHCRTDDCDTGVSQCRAPKPKPSTYGGPCVNDNSCDTQEELVCTKGKCSCKVGSEWNQNTCVRVQKKKPNGTCTKNDDCITKRQQKCIDGKCSCPAGLEGKQDACFVPKKTTKGPCKTNDQCIKERQLKCINEKCDCEPGFSWIEAICKPKAEQPKCNPSVFPNECPHDSKQMECDKDQKVCRCRQDMEYSPSMKACKLKAGENCLINNTLEHDQCLSQQCGNKTESINQTCACPQNNGIPEIWSSDPPGCVTDYFNLPCTESDYECRPATFNTSRQGLICKDNICQCDEGLTYKRGYCVLANLLFGDRCDPDGFRHTCNTDLDLTCRDVGGGDFRCVCLQRVMTVRGKRHTVLLTWNGVQKKCDLKSHGERCKEAIECRSGVCQVTCVGEQPLRSTLATDRGENLRIQYPNSVFFIVPFNMIVTVF